MHHMMRALAWLVLLSLLVGAVGQRKRNFTDADDVLALEPLRDMIRKSNLKLSGWLNKKSKDPCGATNCGVDLSTPACAWEGLACLEGRVIVIEIKGSEGRFLGGALPSTLPSKLKSLHLPSNRLEGRLRGAVCTLGPQTSCLDRWNNLRDLQSLDMGHNNITGGLPEWDNLRQLERLRLLENQLTGQLPAKWTRFTKLLDVDLSQNRIGGELPPSWGALNTMQRLNLAWNELSNAIPAEWVNMTRLERLNLTGNCAICGDVKGRIPDSVYASGLLARHTNLRKNCDSCDGCECDTIPFGLVRHVLISVSVLFGVLFLVCLRKLCVKMRDPGPEATETAPLPVVFPRWGGPTDFAKTAVVLMPDGKEVCMGKQVEGDLAYESSIGDFPDTSSGSESSSSDDEGGDDGDAVATSITFAPAQFGSLSPRHGQVRRSPAIDTIGESVVDSDYESSDEEDEESDVEAQTDVHFSLSGLVPGAGVLAQGSQGERFDWATAGRSGAPPSGTVYQAFDRQHGPSIPQQDHPYPHRPHDHDHLPADRWALDDVFQDRRSPVPSVGIPFHQAMAHAPGPSARGGHGSQGGWDAAPRDDPASGRSSARSHMALIASSRDKYFRQSMRGGGSRSRRRRSRPSPDVCPPGFTATGSAGASWASAESPRGFVGGTPRGLSMQSTGARSRGSRGSTASEYAEELRSLSPGRRRRLVVSMLKKDES